MTRLLRYSLFVPAILAVQLARAGCYSNMTVTVKKAEQLAVPPSVQRRAQIKPGDTLEFKVSGGVITILPKLPSADDEYTPEQRRIVNAQLAEGLDDIRKGRVSRRFENVDPMLNSLKARGNTSWNQKRTGSMD
ncbi:MAG: AbrB/MazE/SpoVT family DNA-binding domain-containing protein [Bryobacteraceae bacterium]